MCGIMLDMKPRIAVSRLPVVFWTTIYEDSSNLDVRLSIPSNPVDPIQPQKGKNSSILTDEFALLNLYLP